MSDHSDLITVTLNRSYFTIFQYCSKNPLASSAPIGAPVAARADAVRGDSESWPVT